MNSIIQQYFFPSPWGFLLVEGANTSLHRLQFWEGESPLFPALSLAAQSPHAPAFVPAIEAWLQAYVQGQDLPALPNIRWQGTHFQQAVWQTVIQVPHGHTISYGQLAEQVAQRLGRSQVATRAVGTALGANPLLLVVPCHRVLRKGGALGGFAAGTARKRQLLQHEAAGQSGAPFSFAP